MDERQRITKVAYFVRTVVLYKSKDYKLLSISPEVTVVMYIVNM